MARNVRIDNPGVAAVLRSFEVRRAVDSVAEEVAGNVRSQGIKVGDSDGGVHEIDLPVKVTSYTTDRVAAAVTLAHAAGIAVQAKHGALTRAAAEAGLEVRS